MNHRVSKFTCLLLALLMVCTLLPATVFAEGGEANAAETPATVQAFLSAVEAISIPEEINDETGPALNEQIGAAQDAYDALSEEELAREDVQAAVEKLSAAMDALTGGAEALASISGESFTVNVVKVVNGNKTETKSITTKCLQSTGHSGYSHSTNLRQLANASGFSGYDGYNWSKYTTVPSKYTKGLAPNNNYASVHYNITGSAPYKADETLFLFFVDTYSYSVTHVYCTNDGQDGTYTESFQAEAGATVYASHLTKWTTYNNNTYTYTSANPTSAKITGNGTTFTLYYDRTVETKPDAPTSDEVTELLNNAVKVDCTNETANHADRTYGLINESFTIGNVEGNADSGYTVKVTVSPAKYVDAYNTDTGVTHTLAPDAQGSKTITLKYNATATAWEAASTIPVTFTTVCVPEPEKPTFEQISDALFVELICTEKGETVGHTAVFKKENFAQGDLVNMYVGKLIEGSITAGDVEWDNALGAWICNVTVDANPYLTAMNEKYTDLQHRLADGQPSTKTVTLAYQPNSINMPWFVLVKQRAIRPTYNIIHPVKFDVICEESTSTPDAPTVANVGLGSVTLVCDRVKAHDKRFEVIESSVQIGEVKQDTAGLYTCDVTVQAAPYLAELNKTSPVHRLANGESGQASWTMYYRNGNWVSDETGGLKVRHISFRVICDAAAPVYPKEYCYIDATATGGGSISPRGTVRVPVYDDQTFYMLAEPGYVLVDVLVDGVSVGAVGSYTFRSVTRHHTIHAVFQPLSALPPQTGGDSTAVLFLGMGLILTACAAFVCLHRRKEN